MLNDSKSPLRKLITLSSAQYLNRMLELRDQLLPSPSSNDDDKLLKSCLLNEDCQSHGRDEALSCEANL